MFGRPGVICWFALVIVTFAAAHLDAAELIVSPQPGALARALAEVQPHDTLRLLPGRYQGPILIDKPLTLDGLGAARVVGNDQGSVITVTAPNVSVLGLQISGSGSSNEDRDSAIALLKGATDAVVTGNRLIGNLIGVDVHGARNALVSGNVIEGRQDHRMNARGNGIYVWNAPGAKIIGNDVRWGRDGIFVNTSRSNVFRANRFRDLRFAIHQMYTNDTSVIDNVSLGNHLGYALMFSKNLQVQGNLSSGDRDYGLMLNYTNSSQVTGNRILRVGDRCLFIYNAHKNRLQGNSFEGCRIGVHFTAGSERNEITGNNFLGNRTQVKYVGSRWLDWSTEGHGNYWSDHASFDLDGDGIADSVFRPNDAMDRVLWTQPAARLLLGSPAIQLIRWSLSAFPALLPGGIVDQHPLMQPIEPNLPQWVPPL
ncbi:MAG: nitrous oxide reductase family maturation protein NosD [Alphaproteobacteria bacterium]